MIPRPSRRFAVTMAALILAALAGAPRDAAEAATAGAWQKRSQLVWDDGAGRLVRKAYVAWNPTPELDLEFDLN